MKPRLRAEREAESKRRKTRPRGWHQPTASPAAKMGPNTCIAGASCGIVAIGAGALDVRRCIQQPHCNVAAAISKWGRSPWMAKISRCLPGSWPSAGKVAYFYPGDPV